MRVLFVTHRFPGQLMRGDQLRAFQQIRHLGQRHAITLLSFGAAEGNQSSQSEIHTSCERVIVAPHRRLGMAWRGLCALWGELPIQVAIYDAVPATVALDELLRTQAFDVAHVQLARLGPMLSRLAPLPCVLDLVDALSLNMARRAEFDRGPLAWIAGSESRRLADYERRLCAQADCAAISSDSDRGAIAADRLHLVRNGFDLQRFRFRPGPRSGGDIVFVGNLGYFPNIDAATWFAEQVLPRIVAQLPKTRFKLVGARPAASLSRLAQRWANIDLIGEVPDVYPYLVDAAVAVVPLRAGSGQQLKLIEAMAVGTPVVATTLSASGMDAVDGQHLLVADSAVHMADAVLKLLRERSYATRLAAAARTLVEQAHSWQQSAQDLEQLWMAAAKRR